MMKKTIVSLCATALLLSCGSVKNAVTVADINGEWDIIEINGIAVVPAPDQEFPFIGFDANDGRVYGNSGCNRMMGTFGANAKPGRIDLSQLGSTRMMCPDMTLENNVLSALARVKTYRKLDDGNMALCGSSKRPIIILKKKGANELASLDLAGQWYVEEVGGDAVSQEMEKQPFLEFNMEEKRLHGNAGCNIINGQFQLGDQKDGNQMITFGQMISTMMVCPDMEVEGKILKALNAVKSFRKLSDDRIGFYDEKGASLMTLRRNAGIVLQ